MYKISVVFFLIICMVLFVFKFFQSQKKGPLKITMRHPLDHRHTMTAFVWKEREYLVILSQTSTTVIDVRDEERFGEPSSLHNKHIQK